MQEKTYSGAKQEVEEIQKGEFYQDLKTKAKEVHKKQKGEGQAEEEGEE